MKRKLIHPGLAPRLDLKAKAVAGSLGLAAALAGNCFAAGPYAPTNWPPTIDSSKMVHYGVVDGVFTAPNANWTNTVGICSLGAGADQGTTLAGCLAGFTGQKAGYNYFNISDTNFTAWATVPEIDILMQVYGDSSVLKRVRFEEGSSAPSPYKTYVTPTPAVGALYSTNAYNFQWNWILFKLTNALWTNLVDNQVYRQVGNIKPGSSLSSATNGGINKGTFRMQSPDTMVGWTVHAVAIGEAGAFGTTNDVNVFAAPLPPDCPPVPANNLVGIDFNAGTSNNLVVVSNADAVLQYQSGVGPADDLRNAVLPTRMGGGGYLYNFGIVSNYLGLPCNPNAVVKICLDFYDDPMFADWPGAVTFGPEAYATDPAFCSGATIYPQANRRVMTGSGRWIRQSWVVPNVNLYGVSTAPDYTGGPRLISKTFPVAISRVEIGILRTGTDPLAGIDPLAGCPADPQACTGVYTNYVELDLANGVYSGLDIGTPTTEQAFVTETAGPANDQRTSVRPDIAPNYYLQFPITGGVLGSNYQDNAHLAIVVTYYDDPALKGKKFGIDAWRYHYLGTDNIFAADDTKWLTLEGTGKWRDAYWEIDRIAFNGVNQGPQAATRFKCEDKVHVCRVRYAVIRSCGPNTGVNLLDSYRVTSLNVGSDTNGLPRLSWPYREPQLTVQSVTNLGEAWSTFKGTPILPDSEQAVVPLSVTNNGSQFFRLFRPSIP